MQKIERIPQVPIDVRHGWQHYLLDTIIAVAGMLLLTGIIYTARLYPDIPDIAIIYLILVLPLAIMRGTYAAILSAVVASLSFDFFLVPPLYTFTIGRWQEWVGLLIFLVTASLISLLAAAERHRAEEARVREHESRILYELIRVTNEADSLDDQLDIVALSVERVFATWGVSECALLLPGADRILAVRADAPIRVERFKLTPDELQDAQKVLMDGEKIEKESAGVGDSIIHLVPLKTRQQIIGVLCLRIRDKSAWRAHITRPRGTLGRTGRDFFITFLDQATSLVERALLLSHVPTREE